MVATTKQVQKILATNGQDIIKRLQSAGESYATISERTGISRSQCSMVANGKRELGERYFRELLRLAIEHGIF